MEAEGFVLCYVVGVSHGLKERVGLHQGPYLLSFFFHGGDRQVES